MNPKQRISRRKYLKSMLLAGAAPYIVPGRVLGADGQTSPSNKITVGVIGVGKQGQHDLKAFLWNDDVRVTAICDVNKRNIDIARGIIEERYGTADVNVHSDFQELNADPSIDAVLMALPVHWHSIPSAHAILQGKHIYHEKPMAMSFQEAIHVREAVRKKGVVFQFGTQQRSNMKFRWACELALNGRLGALKEINVAVPAGEILTLPPEQPIPDYLDWDRWMGPAPEMTFNEEKIQRPWHENCKYYSPGFISCWGIHHLDIAQWGNGADDTGPVSVEGSGDLPGSDSLDTIHKWHVRFEYAQAAPITFTGPGNNIRFLGEETQVDVKRGVIEGGAESLLRDPKNKCDTMPITLPISIDHVANFIDAIKNNGRAISDIEAAVRTDTLCQLARIAVTLQGRKLHWDPKAEHFINDDAANAMLQQRPFRGDWRLAAV